MITALLADHMTWNLNLFLFLTITSILYYFLLLHKNRFPTTAVHEAFLFNSALIILYLAIGSPLLAISYLSVSLHMLQMSVLFFIVPPLLLLGIPTVAFDQISHHPVIKKLRYLFIHPIVALTAFSALFLLYHLPILLTYISKHSLIQQTYLSVLFLLSIRMWWPITIRFPTQAINRSKYIKQSMLFITPACLLFIVGALLDSVNNPFLTEMTAHLCLPNDFSTVQLLPAPFNTKYDQLFAGFGMMGMHKIGLVITNTLGKRRAN
ncbi:cytochrome c oxidase assembly protein [Virgibacillus sp. W0181]|uniref:cytochrome c oxidase assembly protein n=1 Tax=Virgibacillus sp. W0181 TaxID=3391581 RepID=UPI003F455294